MKTPLYEYSSFHQSSLQVVNEDLTSGKKNLYLKGICIQADVKNANGRTYPLLEITKAVDYLKSQIDNGIPILGEADHPNDLKINLDRVSHSIEDVWMDKNNGCGKLKILPTPMGNLIQAMLENGVKLGVSSRGSGEVDDRSGRVSDFEIITVDVVAQPSAPNAYPRAIYEGLMNARGGQKLWGLAQDAAQDPKAQKYFKHEIVKLIKDLKL
jgi:hypothetical protein